MKPLNNYLIFIFVLVIIAYVPLINVSDKGVKAPITYFAADAFYYLNIADKSQDADCFTYDGQHPTNGFHPLWQYYLYASFGLVSDKEDRIYFTFYSSMFFIAIGLALIALALLKMTNNFAVSLFAVTPGFFYFALSIIDPRYWSPWSLINGMESSFSILFFGVLFYLFSSTNILDISKIRNGLYISFILCLIMLSRLDDIFLFIPFFIYAYFSFPALKQKIKNILLFSIPPLLLIGAFLLYNYSYAGMALPVSGMEKSGLAWINLIHFINVFVPIGLFVEKWHHSWELWAASGLRILQITIPLAIALAGLYFIAIKRRISILASPQKHSGRKYTILYFLLLYIAIKGLYNLLIVNIWHQGHWYFPISIIAVNILIAMAISELIKNNKYKRITGLVTILVIIIFGNRFADIKSNHLKERDQTICYYKIWENRGKINSEIKNRYNGYGVLEFEDGIMAYALDYPVMNGIGLALDKEGFEAKKKGGILELAYDRGFKLIATSFYINPMDEAIRNSDDGFSDYFRNNFLFINNLDTENWMFRLLYYDEPSGSYYIEFHPKNYLGNNADS